MFEFSREEAIGHTSIELNMLSPNERAKLIQQQLASGGLQNFELLAKSKSGKPINLLFSSKPLTINDELCHITTLIDITERKKAEEEIKNTSEQLRQLSAHLQTVREEERKRIGREIHDDLGQQLTAIKMDVAWIEKNTAEESAIVKAKLNNILSLLNGSNQSVRKILNELRPAIFDNQDLPDALEWHSRQFTDSTGIPVQFASGVISNKLPEPISTCIFRVYQEALTNIAKYAKAQKVLTSLHSKEDSILLTVEDDGKGFDTAAAGEKRSFGLLGMKERVISLNGQFELISSVGKGTKITISLPYKASKSS